MSMKRDVWARVGARFRSIASDRAIAAAVAALGPLAAPSAAYASITGGGGGMPYSSGLGTLNTSVRGEVAAILIVICIVCGVGGYIIAGQMEGLFNVIGRAMIGIGIIGSVTTIAAVAGVTGALV
jgi:type IV secretory pathway VirB2 component (pilin)